MLRRKNKDEAPKKGIREIKTIPELLFEQSAEILAEKNRIAPELYIKNDVKRGLRNVNGTVPECIYNMLLDECIDPVPKRDYNLWRKIGVLSLRKTELPDVGNFTMQYYADNLLEVIEDMCAVGGIG